MQRPQGPVAAKIAELGEGAVAASIIVAAEHRYGTPRKASPSLSEQLEATLDAMQVLPFLAPPDCTYADARVDLVREDGTGQVFRVVESS